MAEIAGKLTELVRFERRDVSRGVAGERSEGWLPVAERWARVRPVDRAVPSALLAETRHSARRFEVTVRAGVAINLDMRMLWRGQALRLTAIDLDPAEPAVLTIRAEDFTAGGG